MAMKITRRAVFGGLLLPLGPIARSQEPRATTLFVVLEHIPAGLSAAQATQLLDIFLSRGLPVTAALPCTESGLFPVFRAIAERERGLFEIAIEATRPWASERYFQLREAMDQRDCIANTATKNPAVPIISLLDRRTDAGPDPYALRAGGFRMLLRPEASAQGYEALDWGMARLNGGQRARIEDPPETPRSQALYLSFSTALPPAQVLEYARQWAGHLQRAMLARAIFPARPTDHLLQGHPGGSKYIGLVLDYTTPPAPDSPMAVFAAQLRMAGIPFSVLAQSEAITVPEGVEICAYNPALGSHCLAGGAPGRASLAEIFAYRAASPYAWSGPRADGRFHAALQPFGTAGFAETLRDDPLTDRLLLVEENAVTAPVRRAALIGELQQAGWDGKADFYTLNGYMQQTLNPPPPLVRFWSARRRQATAPPRPAIPDRAALLSDARLAWRFIERYTDETTGICAGTVQTGQAETVNTRVALWDVASQMQGIAAAQALGLIAQPDAKARLALLLESLPTVMLAGEALPPALFRADDPASARQEFNACDTGRFLIALDAMVAAGLVAKARAAEVVGQWGLARVTEGQKLLDYKSGRWQDASRSHCTQYARNGYAAWGFTVAQAYSPLDDPQSGDEKIRLLYSAADIGHYGTEPLLLEGLERGFSPESRYLADVLFDAQLAYFEATGKIKCVSETPLDFEPWFAYQGLRVDRSGPDAWVISTPPGTAGTGSPDFARRADIISAKAAYLWAAEYPQAWSGMVLALVREMARVEGLGFSVGIMAETMEAMPGYSDINTNGIILSAIAKILEGFP